MPNLMGAHHQQHQHHPRRQGLLLQRGSLSQCCRGREAAPDLSPGQAQGGCHHLRAKFKHQIKLLKHISSYSTYFPPFFPFVRLKFPLLGQPLRTPQMSCHCSIGARSCRSISSNMGMQHRRSKISERLWSA